MKKLFLTLMFFSACLLATAQTGKTLKVNVSNPTDMERTNETVEIPWIEVQNVATPDKIIVTDSKGKQIPSQVIYEGGTVPVSLIFQANVKGKGITVYIIASGNRENYKHQVFGRYVPERKDDYAWENNVIAFRMYGPALETETITHGIDIWVKRTPELIINKWYKNDLSGEASYHRDWGEGCDCYKVGNTLGCGASAPYVNDKLQFSNHNYATQQTLDNGPIRTTVRVTYNEYSADGIKVKFEKTISLDANTHFNKIIDIYTGDFKTLPIGAGIVKHDGFETCCGKDYVALFEPASDSQSGTDGNIACAVIMPDMKKPIELKDHIFGLISVKNGEPLLYFSGAGWDKNGVTDLQEWIKITKRQAEAIQNPLKIKLN